MTIKDFLETFRYGFAFKFMDLLVSFWLIFGLAVIIHNLSSRIYLVSSLKQLTKKGAISKEDAFFLTRTKIYRNIFRLRHYSPFLLSYMIYFLTLTGWFNHPMWNVVFISGIIVSIFYVFSQNKKLCEDYTYHCRKLNDENMVFPKEYYLYPTFGRWMLEGFSVERFFKSYFNKNFEDFKTRNILIFLYFIIIFGIAILSLTYSKNNTILILFLTVITIIWSILPLSQFYDSSRKTKMTIAIMAEILLLSLVCYTWVSPMTATIRKDASWYFFSDKVTAEISAREENLNGDYSLTLDGAIRNGGFSGFYVVDIDWYKHSTSYHDDYDRKELLGFYSPEASKFRNFFVVTLDRTYNEKMHTEITIAYSHHSYLCRLNKQVPTVRLLNGEDVIPTNCANLIADYFIDDFRDNIDSGPLFRIGDEIGISLYTGYVYVDAGFGSPIIEKGASERSKMWAKSNGYYPVVDLELVNRINDDE